MSDYVIPTDNSIKKVLGTLFGDQTKVDTGDAVSIDEGYVANYIFEDNTVAVCVADHSFVAYSGASMMMLPAGAATEAAEKKDLTPVMVESYYEVAKILSTVMMNATSAHLKLSTLAGPGDDVSFAKPLEGGSTEVSFSVELPGYGTGKLSFLIA